MRTSLVLALAALPAGGSIYAAQAAPPTIVVLPEKIELGGPKARQLLVVEEQHDGKFIGEPTGTVELTSSNPDVVKIDGRRAVPIANGKATITATSGARKAVAEVNVQGVDQPFEWSFRTHVQGVLAKAGCNMGACHGALAGKKGFKLSLRGFDPVADYFAITRQARGRRVLLSDPARSLLLMKPTGASPHKGGVRFGVDSLEYEIVSQWIAAGAPAPRDTDARLDHLEVLPAAATLKPGQKQQLLVIGRFTDGHSEDVTRWAKYTSNNDTVAQVEQDGSLRVAGYGEAVINAWYASQNVVSTITSAYPNQVAPETFAKAPRRNFIDDLVLAKLEALKLPPSPPASDSEFLRRAFIDTIGVLPSIDETRSFLADKSPDKRDRLIESLLARPEYVDYWTYKWCDLLLVSSEKLQPAATWSYYNWIRQHVAANTPWDKFAHDVVTASGSALQNGAANFFVLHRDPQTLAENVSMAFLGMSINCAKCHNHPLEKWTNDQYYSMANLFSRVRVKAGAGSGNQVVYNVDNGELLQPRTGRPQPPTPLDGQPVAWDDPNDRREHLASWLTSAANPYFSRAVTNRVWANFMGVGLVENVDDLRLTNPASNKELMAAAARYLVEKHYDVKALIRAILQSSTYQRSSQATPENKPDLRYYSRYFPRRIMAEVLLDAVSQVTAVDTKFPARFPQGTRALQLPDANVDSYFLKSFGRPPRENTCECERSAMPSMVQVLHISNGDTINLKLRSEGNRLDQLLAANKSDEELIEEAYLSALCRYPTAAEKKELLVALADTKTTSKRLLLEDLFWGVLSSKEFLFNH